MSRLRLLPVRVGRVYISYRRQAELYIRYKWILTFYTYVQESDFDILEIILD